MNKNKKRKVLRFSKSAIAILVSGLFAHNIALANSGGKVVSVSNVSYYVGANGFRHNTVTVTDTAAGSFEDAAGGYDAGTADVTNNTLIIESTGTRDLIAAFGGYSSSGSVTHNAVNINGGKMTTVYGGRTDGSGSVINNTVNISNGTVSFVYGGSSQQGAVQNNTVNVHNGTVTAVYGGVSDSGSAQNNTVNIHDGGVQNVYGGHAVSGSAQNNTVSIYEGTVMNVYGGLSDSGSAQNNTVNITGGPIGYSGGIDIHGGYSYSGSAQNNTVSISGGTIQGNVYGGRSSSGSATYNRVIISGESGSNPIFQNMDIYGGYANNTPVKTGNTLEIRAKGLTGIDTVAGFENYHFILPANIQANDTVLTASSADIANTRIGVGMASSGSPTLKKGDQVTLISAGILSGTDSYTQKSLAGMQGVSMLYEFSLSHDASNLYATVEKAGLNPQTKSFSEGRLAGFAFANSGADLIADEGMKAAVLAGDDKTGISPFIAIEGSHSRYNTGSHTDVNGFSLLAGIAASRKIQNGSITTGAFIEAGTGNYDTYNSFASSAPTRGSGDTRYTGGGLLGRLDFAESEKGKAYAEASIRYGYTKTDYTSGDIRDVSNRAAEYDTGSNYYGFHVGGGYIWKLSEKASLDSYLKYLWTHQKGEEVSINGDEYDFSSTDSHRIRVGGRYSRLVDMTDGSVVSPYAGLSYEHEFDGAVSARTYGLKVAEPDLKGGTGMLELGVSWQAEEKSPFRLEAGIQGYAGKREGITGSFMMNYAF